HYHHTIRDLHSFPTRRSSDLISAWGTLGPSQLQTTPRRLLVKSLPRAIQCVRPKNARGARKVGRAPATTLEEQALATPRKPPTPDRKSTRLNSSHVAISYAVF